MRRLPALTFAVLLLACGDKAADSGPAGSGPGGGGGSGTDDDTAATGDDTGGGGEEGGEDPVDSDGDGVPDDEDCAPADAGIHPGAAEVCDGVDQDCDGEIDEDPTDGGTWYADADGDGFGDPDAVARACAQPEGTVDDATDCDDTSDQALPGGAEVCDGLDNDCDGLLDDADDSLDASTRVDWYADGDGDGYGAGEVVATACDGGAGTARAGGDCDDADAGRSPGETEVCNDVDDDCDDLVDGDDDSLDDASATSYFPDEDGDGYGSDADAFQSCTALSGYLTAGGDCDDADPAINPDADDICDDGVDNDCDGRPDPGCPVDAEDADTIWRGHNANDYAGKSVSAGGDLDGDGVTDLAVGAPGNDVLATNAGAAYVLFGPLTAGTEVLTSAPVIVRGEDALDEAGTVVRLTDDLDGDGYGELLVGAYAEASAANNAGAVYGLAGPLSGASDVSTADFKITGVDAEDRLGQYALGPAGDLDGDGIGDLWLGAHGSDAGVANGGGVFLFFGPVTGTATVATADATFTGAAEADQAGIGFAEPCDVNGDGSDDLVLGAPGGDAAYVVFGPVTGDLDPTDADVTLTGEADTYFGARLASGDFDGDGAVDLAVGARGDDTAASNAGAYFGFQGALSGAVASSSASWTLTGDDESFELGSNVGTITTGDFDGDGADDLWIGSPYSEPHSTRSGAAGLFLGPVSGVVSHDAADQLVEGHGSRDELGGAVTLGDVDGDGQLDLITAAAGDDTRGNAAGAVFVFPASGF